MCIYVHAVYAVPTIASCVRGDTICPAPLSPLVVWCSSNALVLINAVALHRARLVLGWVIAFG